MRASRADFREVTQKVKNEKKHSGKTRSKQGFPAVTPEPNKIAGSTPFDFDGKNLTPYGGLFPVATMLEKLEFQKLVEEMLTVKRRPHFMSVHQFVMAMVLAIYVGFSRLNHLRFVANDPMLTGLLKVASLPGQSTFWRFCAALHLTVARQLLELQRVLRNRVWEAANLQLPAITVDTDTTVHTLYGNQMGARKSYNPKNQGKKSYQPILTFIAETREYIWGELRNGDRPDGKQIARHLAAVFAALPGCVGCLFARADSGFYCWEAVQAYEQAKVHFILVARKTSRLLDQLQAAAWQPSPKTDADEQCEFCYQPEGWGEAYRFIALRYKNDKPAQKREQYQLLDTPQYLYRVFVTVSPADEVHGFRYFDDRDLLGFVDGTENPTGQAASDAVVVGEEDPEFTGGSYVIVQKYLHDLSGWNALSTEAQERIIGRTKLSDIELDDSIKPSSAHNALTTIIEDGQEIKILRDNMPFGRAAQGEFGTYFIGYSRAPSTIEKMLDNMFLGNPPGNYDRLLDFSRAVTGNLFFAPSATFLENVTDDQPPVATAAAEPAVQASLPARGNDGSLGIGSLKGDIPHE